MEEEEEEEEGKVMSDFLPNEVVIEILARLPVKTVARCRRVCKKWCSVISGNSFITTHINRSLSTSRDNSKSSSLRLFQSIKTKSISEVITRHYEHISMCSDDESFGNNNNFIKVKSCPLFCGCGISNYSNIVGFCKGVVCRAFDRHFYANSYVLWNPSIDRALGLPQPNIARGIPYYEVKNSHGFGYDPSSNDFKLVRLVYLERHYIDSQPLVEIYTLNSGCWRAIDSPPQSYIVKKNRLSTFVNGASHWLAHTPLDAAAGTTFRNVILAFDMGKEVFHEIEVPSCFVRESHLNMTVGVRDGLLCLVPHNYKRGEKQYISVWIMNHYGIGESWSKLFDIDISQRLQTVVAFRKNGEVLITDKDGELLSYEPNTQQVTHLGFHRRSSSDSERWETYYGESAFFMEAYSESLVLLNIPNAVSERKEEKVDQHLQNC
ncbi:F-box/kelch-repeat protein At3g23880-like [Juglans regia]|nr:F-box/kelch-repeat protein At3g23880-like [Juglans regia]